MKRDVVRLAVVSAQETLLEAARELVRRSGRTLDLGPEVPLPPGRVDAGHLAGLERAGARIVLLDLADDVEAGIALAQSLVEAGPDRRVIAAGPALSEGQLLAAMRAGVAEYLPTPVSPAALEEAVRRVARKAGWAPAAARRGAVHAVWGAKGGAGCTTLATNLALELQRLGGGGTLLLELNAARGEIPLLLGIEARYSLEDVTSNLHRLDADLLSSFTAPHESGVRVLPAPARPDAAEGGPSAEEAGRLLDLVRRHHAHVVVDAPKPLGPAALAALDRADTVLAVTTLDVPSLRLLQRALAALERTLPDLRRRLRLVANRHDPAGLVTPDDAREALGLEVRWLLPDDHEAVARAANTGRPVVLDGRARYARELRRLAGDLAGAGAGDSERRGILARAAALVRRRRPAPR